MKYQRLCRQGKQSYSPTRKVSCSYDATALFTSVPVDPALNIIKDLMEEEISLHDRTVLSVQNIIELLGFCLQNTYCSFQDKFYEQVEGEAMGSPITPILVTLYMEYFDRKALSTTSIPQAMDEICR